MVTPELVQVIEQLAVQMAGEGKADAAKYLHHWAKQINHLFEVAVHHQGSDEKIPSLSKVNSIATRLSEWFGSRYLS
ncbi:MAG: hypothetical protein HC903_32135, partial [Methylacidiphilales bacterium]|nr:hypothetical protein [Candidatus Methylacidiphilales bacterium]